MPRRRNKHLLHELASLPWWVSVIVAVIVYTTIRWALPEFGGRSVALRAMSDAVREKAWLFAAPFVIVAGVAVFNSRYRRRLLDAQTGIESLRAMTWQDFEQRSFPSRRIRGGGGRWISARWQR